MPESDEEVKVNIKQVSVCVFIVKFDDMRVKALTHATIFAALYNHCLLYDTDLH